MADSFFRIFSNKSITRPIDPSIEPDFVPISSFDGWNQDNYLLDFLEVPEVNAIINILAKAEASGKMSVVSKATGKEVTNNESLVRIIRRPNWFQGQTEYWRQSSIFRSIYGNEYLYFLRPFGMPSSYKGLFTLNPANVKVIYVGDSNYFQDPNGQIKYIYTVNGKEYELDSNDIIHLNDNRVVTDKNFLQGTSKLKALQPAIKNIRAAYKKRNIALNMPIGVMSNGQGDAIGQTVPMDPDEKKAAQRALRTHGALPILTNLAIKYDNMTINSSQLGLFEETREDTGRLCDAFGVPYELLASIKGVTFDNQKEAKKSMYNDTAIPNMMERINALNDFIDGKTYHVIDDFSDNPIFDEDKRQRAISLKQTVEALNAAVQGGLITPDQAQNELTRFGL